MVYLLLLLDILINNYTAYSSYFFIIYLYNKPLKYFILTGLILDFVIFDTLFLNTFILIIMYFINNVFSILNKNNIYNYVFVNIFNYLLFIILGSIIRVNSVSNTLIIIGSNLFINGIFYLLTAKTCKN